MEQAVRRQETTGRPGVPRPAPVQVPVHAAWREPEAIPVQIGWASCSRCGHHHLASSDCGEPS